MAMEKFERQRISGVPGITIRKNGSISFNEMAVEQFPIKEKKHAELFFDQEENTIGIRPIESNPGVAAFIISREKGKQNEKDSQQY